MREGDGRKKEGREGRGKGRRVEGRVGERRGVYKGRKDKDLAIYQ